jgi:hypothetical protein
LLSPGGPGLPPVWVTAGLVVPAFCALLARRRMTLVYAGWGVALAGLVVALVASRVRVTPPQGGTAISAWPGIAIAVAAAGLLLAAAPLIEALTGAAGRRLGRAADLTADLTAERAPRTGWRVLAAVAGCAVVASAPVLAAGYWLVAGVGGPVAAASPQILPAFVAASSAGPDRNRTLVLRTDGGALSYTVLRDADPVLGEPELTVASSSTRALADVVAALGSAGSGDTGDTGQALSQFDIGYVLLPAPIDQALAQQLDAAAGLTPLTSAPAYDLWQVSGTVARTRVVTAGGTALAVPSGAIGVNTVLAPATSGTLVLAEAAGGWSATLNGTPLTPLAKPVDGWAQGFVLPAGGGHLVISRNQLARDLSLGGEAVVLLVAFALALPGTRSSLAIPAAAQAGADSGAAPGAGRRSNRADGPRAARRKRRPQFALAGARARAATPPDGTEAGYGSASRTVGPAPATFSPAAGVLSDADAAFGSAADPEYASTAGAGVHAGAPAAVGATPASGYGSAPRISSAHSADDDPAPWSGLGHVISRPDPGIAPSRPDPGIASRADAAPEPPPARRGRGGQHAARHGKPSRRGRANTAATADRAADKGADEVAAGAPEAASSPRQADLAPWERGDAP